MNDHMNVIVDADAIIAQADSNDFHHATSIKISQYLEKAKANLIYPTTTIAESNSYIQRMLSSTPSAYGTAVVLSNPDVQVATVSQETIRNALRFFSPTTSKKNTLFDCIVTAVAEEYKAEYIFSFDKFYEKAGFKLAIRLLG